MFNFEYLINDCNWHLHEWNMQQRKAIWAVNEASQADLKTI